MSKAKVFVPLTKVDEEQRLVYGVITEEVKDKAGEVMDYNSSKPNFEKWSGDIEKASGGKSKGNVRVMHQLKVAGKLEDIAFNDEDKSIEVCAKVVDDEEWNKVLEGCYTGFSVGGTYGKKWTDKKEGLKKYTAVPNEVSLVDNPCVHGATFTMVKADGAEETVLFKSSEDPETGTEEKTQLEKQAEKAEVEEISNDVLFAKCKELQKAAGDDRDWMSFIDEARAALLAKADDDDDKGEGEEEDEDDDDDKEKEAAKADFTVANRLKQVWTTSDGKTFEKKADAEAHEEQLMKTTQEGDDEITKLSKSISRIKDVLEKNEQVELGDEPQTPSIFSLERIEDLHKAVCELELPRSEDGSPKLEKGTYTMSRFACLLGDIHSLAKTIKAEGKIEGNDGEDEEVWKTLQSQLATFGDSFMTYAKNQIAELVAGLDVDLGGRVAYDYYYRAAEADPENALAKFVCETIESVEEERTEAFEKLSKAAEVSTEDTPETLEKVAKLEEDNERLKKVVDEVLPTVEALEKRLKIVEDTPLPRAPSGKVFGKADDGNFSSSDGKETMENLQEMLKTMSPDDIATLLIKHSQQNPQKMGFASR